MGLGSDVFHTPEPYVRRERLLRRLLAGRIAVVEASSGYGKSVLAWQYRQALGVATVQVALGRPDDEAGVLTASVRRALAASRLSDLSSASAVDDPAGAIDRLLDALAVTDDGVLLVLDDAHHIRSAAAGELVVRLATGLAPQHRLLIAARRLTGELALSAGHWGAAHLDTGALAFTVEEAGELIHSRFGFRPSERDARELVEATGGWATALLVAASVGTADRAGGSDLIGPPVRRIVDTLDERDRAALIELAHLPFVSPELCDRAAGAGGTLERFVDVGVPLARTGSGWWELPSPVADYLAALGPVADATVLAAAQEYARAGEPLSAIRALLGAGLASNAAAMLAALAPDRAEDLGLAVIRELVESLGESAVAEHPAVLLHMARVAEVAHEAELRAAAIARAGRTITGAAAPRLRRELDAERARDLHWDERTRPQAQALAASVIELAGEGELVARARALDVLGRLASWFSSTGPQPEAEALLTESARLARRAGQRTWAAQALVPLAIGFYYGTCRYERAIAVLEEALAELPARNRYRAMVLTFRADVLVEVGRYAEAESSIAEMREIGRWCGEQWVLAYAAWGEAALASFQGDAARTVSAVVAAEQHRDAWFEQPSGVEFLAQACDYLSRAGEHELALEYLARARARMAGTERTVRVYEAAVLARSGDPLEAEEAIVAALAGPAVDPQERWPLMLLRAHAAARRGAPEAGRLAAEAFDVCLALGHPEGPLVREHAIADGLLSLAAAAGSRAAAALMRTNGTLTIRLLGGFEVSRAGRTIELPEGRPAKAVRAIAAAGGRLHSEQLIELLWPDVDPLTGRSRLRNLLNRVRAAAGELLVRERDTIALAPGTEIDADVFERQAEAALSADDPGRADALARAALERYLGELLPDDRYEPWAAARRERLAARRLELLDLLAATAQERGETDEATRLLARAIEAEPYDEQRYLLLARLLASQGRSGSALAALRRATAALAELGLEPSPALRELERALGGRPEA